MNPRQLKAVEIAARFRIQEKDNGKWIVPSQSTSEFYKVGLNGIARCSCPDFDTRGLVCKHIRAVMIRIKELKGDKAIQGSVAGLTQQNWSAYNKAQTTEKDQFRILLRDLVGGIAEPARNARGRKPIPISDGIFAAAFKVYSGFSGRRFMSDLREAQAKGFIEKTPHFNSIFNILLNPDLTEILQGLITQSSLPLVQVETNFAADASGFSTSRFDRWIEHKWGKRKSKRQWLKAHLMCGVRTNVVTAVQITEGNQNDCPLLPPLLHTTSMHFPIHEVSADKGYLSEQNVEAIAGVGAKPFIAFKSNSKPRGSQAWNRMYSHFISNRVDYLNHYHKRSNVETAFSMIKRKFGDSLRSKTHTSLTNEALCKVLCHNIVVLIHEMYELGIKPDFVQQNQGNYTLN